ncbi:uncharacterized protein [Amphiura filiformis]|uniref:uncharacterized protein n=1 Tax=Amphiura filiformis TaxID=82378 RepID=UPI003B221DDF
MRPHKCKYCQRFLCDAQQYLRHRRRHEQQIHRYWYNCKKKHAPVHPRELPIPTDNTVDAHEQIHTKDERNYKCQYCNEEFKHQHTHDMEKPYICCYCKKGFKYFGDLIIHQQTHTKDKRPYKCLYCKEEFKCYGDRAIHQHTHDMEKPCFKYFGEGDLTIHQQTHTNEKPVIIQSLQENSSPAKDDERPSNDKFAHLGDHTYIKHPQNHYIHVERRHKCQYCTKWFSQSEHLKTHEKSIQNALHSLMI